MHVNWTQYFEWIRLEILKNLYSWKLIKYEREREREHIILLLIKNPSQIKCLFVRSLFCCYELMMPLSTSWIKKTVFSFIVFVFFLILLEIWSMCCYNLKPLSRKTHQMKLSLIQLKFIKNYNSKSNCIQGSMETRKAERDRQKKLKKRREGIQNGVINVR